MQKQVDRISFSFGMKLSLPAKYESADFHISFTSDVNDGETLDQAFDRVKREVIEHAQQAYKSIRESEDGLEQRPDTRDVATSAVVETKKPEPVLEAKTVNIKSLKGQIKSAFAVLEAQKKITPALFAIEYLSADKEKVNNSTNLAGAINKKIDEMKDVDVSITFLKIRNNFKELGL